MVSRNLVCFLCVDAGKRPPSKASEASEASEVPPFSLGEVGRLYFDILHDFTFYTYPIGVQDTFGIHIRYIKIHVSYALP